VENPGPHTVRILDMHGRLIATYRGNGPKSYSLRGLGLTGLGMARISTTHGILNKRVVLF
jgi:hypothetical protein